MVVIVGDLQQQGPCLERKKCLYLLPDAPLRCLPGNQAHQTLLLVAKEVGHQGRRLLRDSTRTAGMTEYAQGPGKAIRHLKYVQSNVTYLSGHRKVDVIEKKFIDPICWLGDSRSLAPSSMSKYIWMFVRAVKQSDVTQ